MKKFHFSSVNKEAVKKLASAFMSGETFTIAAIIEAYELPTKEKWQKVMSRQKVAQWLKSVRVKLYKEEGIWLTGIKESDTQERTFGFVSTKGEAEYAMTKYYTLTKGVVKSANKLALNIKQEGLLKGGMTTEELLLPKVKGKK